MSIGNLKKFSLLPFVVKDKLFLQLKACIHIVFVQRIKYRIHRNFDANHRITLFYEYTNSIIT